MTAKFSLFSPCTHSSILSPYPFLSSHPLHTPILPPLPLPQAKAFVADPSSFVPVVTKSEEVDKGQEEVEEKKEEEEEEESDDDMGFGLFD